MFSPTKAFGGFSVDDEAEARRFYAETLGLHVVHEGAGLWAHLPDGGRVFVYPKPSHEPASFTVLNFVVESIDAAVDARRATIQEMAASKPRR